MGNKLANRQKKYEKAYDQEIIRRLPIIIRIDGKNFSKVTKKLPRPFDSDFMDLMANTMLSLVKDVDGTVFAYQQSDEITLVLRNDQTFDTEPYFGNRIQKLVSISAANATYEFNNQLLKSNIKLTRKALFDARVCAVPSITEAANNLIWRQQDCMRNAVANAARSELGHNLVKHKNQAQQLQLLKDKCNIVFDTYYPSKYKLGIASYRVPTFVDTKYGRVSRNKWVLDYNIPKFSDDREFLLEILNSGRDIFRADRDLNG